MRPLRRQSFDRRNISACTSFRRPLRLSRRPAFPRIRKSTRLSSRVDSPVSSFCDSPAPLCRISLFRAEVWSRSALARHVREHADEAGYPSLSRAAKATVQQILAAQPLHPEKVKYYVERRDPDFETKMREVLLVYQEVALQNQNGGLTPLVITVSVEEKPGLQAIAYSQNTRMH